MTKKLPKTPAKKAKPKIAKPRTEAKPGKTKKTKVVRGE